MKIALAAAKFPESLAHGLTQVKDMSQEAAAAGAEIICFPETFLPGYPLLDFSVGNYTEDDLKTALQNVCTIAKQNGIAIIIPMNWYENADFLNVAFVVSADGEVLGYQAKNQLDPSEDGTWAAGKGRRTFKINGVCFGIVICHEGFRYPETCRWAAQQGAQIVFHPHFAGSDTSGITPTTWGDPKNPYYEKAMMMRSVENTIYFASVNYATRYPESATTIVSPDGSCLAYQPYGKPGVLIADLDLSLATGLLAKRFKPHHLKQAHAQ